MYNFYIRCLWKNKPFVAKFLLIMKLTVLLLIIGLMQVSADTLAQKVTLSEQNVPLRKVFDQIRAQTGYDFLFTTSILKEAKPVSITVKGVEMAQVLEIIFENQPLIYTVQYKSIIVKQKNAEVLNERSLILISGKVINEMGEGLSNITVTLKGTKVQTMTNGRGEFKIQTPDKQTILVFSGIGYENREIATEPNLAITVTLVVVPSKLSEIIVIGYGTAEKRNLTGAIGSLKINAIGGRPNSIDQALTGRLAGVQVLSSSGVPGASPAITIRGVTSINGKGNSPLIVIDGVPMYGIDKDLNTVNFSGRSYSGTFTGNAPAVLSQNQRETFEKNPLSLINPEDVESIEVLKDAFATAIYGSRGASGVILIKTKQGKLNAPRMDIQLSSSRNTPFSKHKLMNGDQYADLYNTYFQIQNKNLVYPKGVNTNWVDEVEDTGSGYNASFNISNANEKGSYYISGSYTSEQPYIIANNYNRYSGRVNLNQNLNKLLNIGTNLTLSTTRNGALNANLIYGDAAITAPNKPVFNSTGDYLWNTGSNPVVSTVARDLNAVGYANTTTNYLSDNSAVGNIFAEVKLLDWAKFRSELGIDWETSRAYSRFTSKPRTIGGLASENLNWKRKWVINNTINFNKTISQHNLNGVIGQSFESSTENSTLMTANNFPNDQVLSLNSAGTRTFVSALKQEWALVSYFARLNYLFKGRYMAGVTYRVDGSSKFSEDRRYIGFPSFSAGWDISKEKFMERYKFVDQFKLRGSFGLSGSDGGAGYYGNKGIYANIVANPTWAGDYAIVPITPNNPDLKWESRTKYNIGTDISLFKSRLNITADYYNEQTKNAILAFPIPGFLGFTSQPQNVGELSNKGVELSISSVTINKPNFKWNTMFNITRNVNRVNKLYEKNGQTDPIALGRSLETNVGRFLKEGESATAFFLYEWGGVNPANGNPLWIDKDGKSTEVNVQLAANGSDANRKLMGDAAPKFFGGFDNTFTYKGIELDLFFTYAYGNKMINGTKAYLYAYTSNEANNLSPDILDYWKKAGQVTDIPALLNSSNSNTSTITGLKSPSGTDYTLARNTSRFLEDASYIKLKSATVAYTVKPALIKKIGISNLKFYAQTDNVFVMTKYSGIDPEVSAFGSSALQMGRDEFTMPSSRTFRLGVKMGF